MKHLILATTIAAAILAGATSAEQYVCTDNTQTGFYFNSNTENWLSYQWFEDHSFLVDTDAETVSQFGRSGVIYGPDDCKRSQNASDDNSYLACHSFDTMMGMIINRDLLRFTRTYYAGYVTGDQEIDTPLVAIGTCAVLGG